MNNEQRYQLYMQVAGTWLQQLEDTTAEDRRNQAMEGWITLALKLWMRGYCNV